MNQQRHIWVPMNQQQPRLILDPVQVNRENGRKSKEQRNDVDSTTCPPTKQTPAILICFSPHFVAGNCQAGLSSCSWRDPKNYCERLKNAHFQSLQCMERITFLQWWRCIQYTIRVLIASQCLLYNVYQILKPSSVLQCCSFRKWKQNTNQFFPFCQGSHKHCGDLIDHWWGGLCAQTQSCD